MNKKQKLKWVALLALLALLTGGCTVTRMGDFKRVSFMQEVSVPHLIIETNAVSGRLEMKGYMNDGGQKALKKASELLKSLAEVLEAIPAP